MKKIVTIVAVAAGAAALTIGAAGPAAAGEPTGWEDLDVEGLFEELHGIDASSVSPLPIQVGGV